MGATPHTFHIPVMGTGFTIDTPLRVARFGISSVISIVDDALIERVRRHWCARFDVACEPITAREPDARARRITAYLDAVAEIVERQVSELARAPFAPESDKSKYFELLPTGSPLRRAYFAYLDMPAGAERDRVAAELSAAIVPGSIDVNIMTKLDRMRFDRDGASLGPEHTDAKAALRGFARSRVRGDVVLSAGMNPTLFGLLESFPDFYADASGDVRKGVILKVSDLRSALVQGKFLAKKGIAIKEFRIESGLNCGGHAFATNGHLLGPILREFREQARELSEAFEPAIAQHYAKNGRPYRPTPRARITVQGGIGTFGETQRLCEYYGADGTGWGSPFLLVSEATALDAPTRAKLADATEDDLYLSDVSPLGVPFNNLRGSSSEIWTTRHIDAKTPGSACPRGYLASNTEFTKTPICTASREYQDAKLRAMGLDEPPPSDTTDPSVRAVYQKTCICNHLGNGALIDLGLGRDSLPVAVCPGPNIAYFTRQYSLREMVDHVYGRGPSLVPEDRPHMFVKDLAMYVDHFLGLVAKSDADDSRGAAARLVEFRANLEAGIAHYRELVRERAFPGENLASLAAALDREAARLSGAPTERSRPVAEPRRELDEAR